MHMQPYFVRVPSTCDLYICIHVLIYTYIITHVHCIIHTYLNILLAYIYICEWYSAERWWTSKRSILHFPRIRSQKPRWYHDVDRCSAWEAESSGPSTGWRCLKPRLKSFFSCAGELTHLESWCRCVSLQLKCPPWFSILFRFVPPKAGNLGICYRCLVCCMWCCSHAVLELKTLPRAMLSSGDWRTLDKPFINCSPAVSVGELVCRCCVLVSQL
jgi:hypothetical protein